MDFIPLSRLNRSGRPFRLTPPQPWRRVSDAEWRIIAPLLRGASPRGRPMFDGRWRFDACLFAAQMDGPWPDLPEKFGPWGTVRRQFQRWAHNGTWSRLLEAVAAPDSPLAGLEYALCRAHRRAWRLLDLKGIRHARELGLESALRAPPEYLPDPNLSLFVNSRFILPRIETYLAGEAPRPSRQELRAWNGLLRLAGGRAVIRRHMAPP